MAMKINAIMELELELKSETYGIEKIGKYFSNLPESHLKLIVQKIRKNKEDFFF